MSVTGLSSDPNRLQKNSLHWRNDSGELDVFEAARYFSGANENYSYNNSSTFAQNFAGENKEHSHRVARMSLDIPATRNIAANPENLPMIHQKQLMKENKKFKQPSSPGGRLASFLNSLFNQTAAKKKKKSKSKEYTTSNNKVEDQEIRKRRSSISHFRITTTSSSNSANNDCSNSSSSGFTTPSIYAKTPTKSSHKEFQSFSDQEFRFSNGNILKNVGSFRNSATNWNIIVDEEEKGIFRKFSDVDDGADTDSSSDLFDLPNHDLGLPVYGTTDVDRIRINGASISSVATV